jgi:hypothetical protein
LYKVYAKIIVEFVLDLKSREKQNFLQIKDPISTQIENFRVALIEIGKGWVYEKCQNISC